MLALGIAVAVLGGTVAVAEAARSGSPRILSFKQFVADTPRMKDGVWIVNGDEPIYTRRQLKAFYKQVRRRAPRAMASLIVNRVGGGDDRWSSSAVAKLTYCVSTRFGGDHSRVVTAMAGGAAKWENASRADFIYVPAENGNCTTRNSRVVFSVEPTGNSGLYARAFFPSTSKRQRNILVNARNTFNGDYQPDNILGHELGHTLGFRHEHTRPEAGTCFEDSLWRALTPYDRNSIMHYPWCNGGTGALTFSSSDGQGAAALYGN